MSNNFPQNHTLAEAFKAIAQLLLNNEPLGEPPEAQSEIYKAAWTEAFSLIAANPDDWALSYKLNDYAAYLSAIKHNSPYTFDQHLDWMSWRYDEYPVAQTAYADGATAVARAAEHGFGFDERYDHVMALNDWAHKAVGESEVLPEQPPTLYPATAGDKLSPILLTQSHYRFVYINAWSDLNDYLTIDGEEDDSTAVPSAMVKDYAECVRDWSRGCDAHFPVVPTFEEWFKALEQAA